MDERTTRAILVAGLGIFAVALAAATLSSAVAPDSGIGEGANGDGDGLASSPVDGQGQPVDPPALPEWVYTLLTLLAALCVLVLAIYVVVYWRETVPVLVVSALAVVVLWALFRQFSPAFEPPDVPAEAMNMSAAGNGGGGNGEAIGGTIDTSLVVVVLLGLALLGVVAVLLRSAGETAEPTDVATDDEVDVEAIGRSAGRTADRIESGDELGNEVYRAWREMTDLLDVSDPETTTPGEFSNIALEAGLEPDDVDELTRLFEDVRYGGYAPTKDRERRAIDVFRRIEAEYAPADTEPDSDAGTENP